MEVMQEKWNFPASNGEGDIFARAWLPEKPAAIVQISHGMSEHSGRYDEFARFLSAHGFGVVANDHAGHALSHQGHLGAFASKAGGFDRSIEDLHRLFALAEEKCGALPRILFGHSMGSILTALYAERHEGLTALVLCGTPAAIKSSRMFQCIAGFIVAFKGHTAGSPLLERLTGSIANLLPEEAMREREWLSRDMDIVRAFTEDPHSGFDYTAGGYLTMLKAYHYLYLSGKWGGRIPDIPILVVGGDADTASDMGKGPEGYAAQLTKTGHTHVDLKLFHEHRHEILNEIGREEVYAYLLDWFTDKLPR